LITGETGTGKEELANLLVANSPRGTTKYAALNCVGMEGNLFASELFGHVKGAYTDASGDSQGRLALLDGGTVLLDELGELSTHDQAMLLRFMQTGEIQSVGEDRARLRRVNVRVIATTNINVNDSKRLRPDLKERFGYHIELPPLRDRPGDIIRLLCMCLWPYDIFTAISIRLVLQILCYQWPGNIRELQNCCNQALELARTGKIADGDHGRATDFVLRNLQGIGRSEQAHRILELYLQKEVCRTFLLIGEGTPNPQEQKISNFNKLAAESTGVGKGSCEFHSVRFKFHPRWISLQALENPSVLPECYDSTELERIFLPPLNVQLTKELKPQGRRLVEALQGVRSLALGPPEEIESIIKEQIEEWEGADRPKPSELINWFALQEDSLPDFGPIPTPNCDEGCHFEAEGQIET
jgi:hypothetical protein